MQAWKELQYMNCYWLNSDNRNSITVCNNEKNDNQKSKKKRGGDL